MRDPGALLLDLTNRANAVEIFAAATLGFAAIYFGLGALTAWMTTRVLPRLGVGRVIDTRPLVRHQVRDEVLRSLASIAIFGLYGVLTVALDARGLAHLRWALEPRRLLADLIVMTVWNEVHFYACHRLLHVRWLYKRVHLVHHRSVRPTPWSTYSFHPVEAALLGSVMICALAFWDLTIFGAILYPLVSLSMNVLGHSNYALSDAGMLGNASARHSLHHQRVRGNYGFLVPWLDAALRTAFRLEAPRA